MKKEYFSSLILFVSTLFLPSVVFGQSAPTIESIIFSATRVLNRLIPFAIGLGLVIFLFAIIKYVTAGGGEDKAKARNLMIFGIISIFVMVSVWGLVGFIQTALGINGNNNGITSPSVPLNPYSQSDSGSINSNSRQSSGSPFVNGSPAPFFP